MNLQRSAREIASFLGIPESAALAKLNTGFAALHAEVAQDWRRANPRTEEEILRWYRTTESYIWELAAYHTDPAWNYDGTCIGIGTELKHMGFHRVLCLGDGIGDLTSSLREQGLDAVYHDLWNSKTMAFARFAYEQRTGQRLRVFATHDFSPGSALRNGEHGWDAIVSLDYLEHCPNVEEWTAAIHQALRPGGVFVAQNAFNVGSGPKGSIPCHLAVNDRFEKEWDQTLQRQGFEQIRSQWYRKAA